MRSLVPADALIYLETNDLGAAIQPVIDSKPFSEAAKYKPDLSAIKGVQLAVAVTGFEMAEEKLNEEQSVGNIKPHFVAIADTHAWNWQAVGFAETKLGGFVADIYDSEPSVAKTYKNGGTYFTWTAPDGRKAFAFVRDGLIYFGNDESSIEKCLAVGRSEADNIAKAGKVPPPEPGTLASGYVGPDGIAQLANIIGLKLAAEAAEDSEVQSAIASIVPQLLRSSVTGLIWTARQADLGVEDSCIIAISPDIAGSLAASMVPPDQKSPEPPGELGYIPADAQSVTIYNFKGPVTAWQTVVSVAQAKVGQAAGPAVGEFANLLLEPYGVRDAQSFLQHLDGRILTARFADGDDRVVMIASETTDATSRKTALTSLIEQNVAVPAEAGAYMSEDGDLKAVLGEHVILGDADSVSKCQQVPTPSRSFASFAKDRLTFLQKGGPSVITIGNDIESASQIANVLSAVKNEGVRFNATYATRTRFSDKGLERNTVSDLGLIGSIIAQLGSDRAGM
jgi:hypothetical protein